MKFYVLIILNARTVTPSSLNNPVYNDFLGVTYISLYIYMYIVSRKVCNWCN